MHARPKQNAILCTSHFEVNSFELIPGSQETAAHPRGGAKMGNECNEIHDIILLLATGWTFAGKQWVQTHEFA